MACIKFMQWNVRVPSIPTSVKHWVGYEEEEGQENKRARTSMEEIWMDEEEA